MVYYLRVRIRLVILLLAGFVLASRFQIRHKLWPGGDAQNPEVALAVGQEIMRARLAGFQLNHKREATNFEFFVLWNAPWQADHPSAVVTERARRFANLVECR